MPPGPLTNIAELFEHYPAVRNRIDHLTIMGGSLSGGNVTPYAEFNFCADPDAAQAVLGSGVPLNLLGLDVTHKAYLTDEEIQTFAGLGTKHGDMVGDLMKFYAESYKKTGLPGTPVHDASAVLYEAEPGLFPGNRVDPHRRCDRRGTDGRMYPPSGAGAERPVCHFGSPERICQGPAFLLQGIILRFTAPSYAPHNLQFF